MATIQYKDQTALAVLAKTGNEAAKAELVTQNQKFVIMVARQYIGQGMELADMVQEGNIGLLRAIEVYDADTGNKFLTYASWWIKQAILQALGEHNRQVRLPANRINALERYRRIKESLSQELSRDPSQGEILDEMGIAAHELYEQRSISYSTAIKHEDGEGSLLDVLENKEIPAPDAALMAEAMTKEIEMVLKKLQPREQTILKMSYGIGLERSYTLEEIGEHLKLTRERIRQIREKALKQLRRLNRRKQLEGLKN